MRRIPIAVRPGWEKIVEDQGLTFYNSDDQPYWDESAHYEFSAAQIDQIEEATLELDKMCLSAVENVISRGLWQHFQINPDFAPWVTKSWDEQQRSIYGRFDLWFDGRDIKLLEYNADTPTGLIEASIAQWYWVKDRFGEAGDQFNSIHERLIEAWAALRQETGSFLYVASIDDGEEDFMTANYLRDTAAQAGFETHYLPVESIAWSDARRRFVDEKRRDIQLIFKLYPWEWLVREEFGKFLPTSPTRWVEPAWKMILSNKALLPLLWELFPDHPLLLRAEFEPWNNSYAKKPIFAREGANVSLIENGVERASSGGLYTGPFIYQDFRALPGFDGNYPVLGSWMIGGHAAGMGIREDRKLITSNQSRFVPHNLV
jgi:glutathionylspermidine synthase